MTSCTSRSSVEAIDGPRNGPVRLSLKKPYHQTDIAGGRLSLDEVGDA